MSWKLQIASTYEREVEVEIPGTGLEPQKVKITCGFSDVDPEELETEQQKIQRTLQTLLTLIQSMRAGAKPEEDKLQAAEEQIGQAGDITPKLDRVLAYVKLPDGALVEGRDGQPIEGHALVEFAKRYPRWREPIRKAWEAENESGEPAHLGNLLSSAGRTRG